MWDLKILEKKKIFIDISTNKSLIKEQLSLEFVKIFKNEFKNQENFLEFINLTTKEIFKKCEILLNNTSENNEINIKDLNYLLKNEIDILNNDDFINYQKLKKEMLEYDKKVTKKIIKNSFKTKDNENLNLIINDEYLNKIIKNENLLKIKLDQLLFEKNNEKNQNNFFDNAKL